MDSLEQTLIDRLAEIDAYLDLLTAIENQVRDGVPRVGETVITTTQQKILHSSVYLQLYNLIEATVSKCIDAISQAIIEEKRWRPADLSAELRREWVRFLAETHKDLNYDNRLAKSLSMCEHLLKSLPVENIHIHKGGGGNWDDVAIYELSIRLGITLSISPKSNEAVKRPYRNNKGALASIVRLRNDLAHGGLSFVECGDDVTVTELRELKEKTAMYLQEVVASFQSFVSSHSYLSPESRPTES